MWAAILLLSAGMFFELYDLLFSAYIAPTLVKKRAARADDFELLRPLRRRRLHRRAVHRSVHRHLACGFLADRFGRRTVFVASLLWYTVANVVVALQTDAFGLNLWRFISGVGLGVEMVTIGAYLSEMAPKIAWPGVRLFAGDRLLLRP